MSQNNATGAAFLAGPLLIARGVDADGCRLAAILVTPDTQPPPDLFPEDGEPVTPTVLASAFGWAVRRYDFVLPRRAGGATYTIDGRTWRVQTEPDGPRLRIAYTSCNGQEHDDLFNPRLARNTMWHRLGLEHGSDPFALLLQGGDQLYADNVWHCHPELQAWAAYPVETRLRTPLSEEAAIAVRRFYWTHYVQLWSQPDVAPLLAEIPSLMMWDDHDIFDGWGSHAAEFQACPAWRTIYAAAREAFALFQLGGTPEQPPETCLSDAQPGFSWCCRYGDTAIVAPDLRSERTSDRIMGVGGWQAVERWRRDLVDSRHVLVMSSVPALGPRLSWIERLMGVIPHAQRYEDDLRDQWQSRAHRHEWQVFLQHWLDLMGDGPRVTLLSGEIHLATRGTMTGTEGTLHQLVASGMAHPPPPRGYARALGGLARLGESPLPGHPIALHALPGRRGIYVAERNYLVLERNHASWSARWETEDGGPTPHLDLT